jgi:predicted nucleic acid-binding protein
LKARPTFSGVGVADSRADILSLPSWRGWRAASALCATVRLALETYRQFLDGCDMQPMNRQVFDLATELRVQHAIKTPDALHLAAALLSSCREFWTDDKRLASAAQDRIRIVSWQ